MKHLILQETLAKVMKAIDELPKSESQLLKERYLDDASYDEMETRHGLSHSVLAMRLLRAREKVKNRVGKLIPAFVSFSWLETAKKMLTGGLVAVKITMKTKLIVTGIAIIIVSGGTGVYVWHSHQSAMESSENSISKVAQNVSQQSSAKSIIAKNTKDVAASKFANQEMEKSKKDELSKTKTNELLNMTVKSPTEPTSQAEQQEETLVEKYDRIVNSPEYISDRDREGGIFA